MKKTLSALIASVCFVSHSTAQQTFDPQTFGHWVFETGDGIKGSVTVGPGSCRYTFTTSFSNSIVLCQASWNPYDRSLSISGLRANVGTTVPDYQPERSVVVTAGSGQPLVSFELDEISSRSMKGHLIGVGDNVHVTLKKH